MVVTESVTVKITNQSVTLMTAIAACQNPTVTIATERAVAALPAVSNIAVTLSNQRRTNPLCQAMFFQSKLINVLGFFYYIKELICGIGLIGNGFCNHETNFDICNFDGGDCCTGNDILCQHCFLTLSINPFWNCRCHETGDNFCTGKVNFHLGEVIYFMSRVATCPYAGDLNCNGENNNQGCNFDDGDCCLEETNCQFCQGDECLCHEIGESQCTFWG